ncbi:hypothetical protein Tco_1369200 [Tanacetum coccineum]
MEDTSSVGVSVKVSATVKGSPFSLATRPGPHYFDRRRWTCWTYSVDHPQAPLFLLLWGLIVELGLWPWIAVIWGVADTWTYWSRTRAIRPMVGRVDPGLRRGSSLLSYSLLASTIQGREMYERALESPSGPPGPNYASQTWEADVILGIRIKHESNGIAISQSHYIEKVFLLGGGAIYWASKKQTCIIDSTMESKFVALAAAGKEAEWLSQMYNRKSRHLGIRHSMIREQIMNGMISIEFVRSEQKLVDHLMKRLARDLVIKFAEGMRLKVDELGLPPVPRASLRVHLCNSICVFNSLPVHIPSIVFIVVWHGAVVKLFGAVSGEQEHFAACHSSNSCFQLIGFDCINEDMYLALVKQVNHMVGCGNLTHPHDIYY